MTETVISRDEQIKWWVWWKNHISELEKRGVVSKEHLDNLRLFITKPEDIGYNSDCGQIRPGDLGQWDIFYNLDGWGIPYSVKLLLSGLSDAEVKNEETREKIRNFGLDPDSKKDVVEFHRISNMSPKALDMEIKRLEALLVA